VASAEGGTVTNGRFWTDKCRLLSLVRHYLNIIGSISRVTSSAIRWRQLHEGKAILIDLGGVLIDDYLPAAATEWGGRLGLTPPKFLAALFGGSDDQVLTGRVSESAWWEIVAGRPDTRIYQAALTALSARPQVTLFIDDTPGHVRAAEALGMTGHVHTGSASTIARIGEFLAVGEFPADG
jgi:hypothetical protein